MSVRFISAVLDSDIGPVHKRMVLVCLADNCNDSGLCRPGIEHTVGKSQVARSTVFRILADLEEEGILQRRERRRANGSRRSNAYKLNLPAIQARKRVVSKAEEDELEALFDDDGATPFLDGAAGQPHSPAPGPCAAGQEESAGRAHSPAPGRSAAHSPAPGRSGGPAPGPLEPSVDRKNPPNPPHGGGDQELPQEEDPAADRRCTLHRRRNCRACGISPRAQVWAERDAAADRTAAAEAAGRACGMCMSDGPRSTGGTRWVRVLPGTRVMLLPAVICDHDTSHAEVVQAIADEEAAAARARETPRTPPPVERAISYAELRAMAKPKGAGPRPRPLVRERRATPPELAGADAPAGQDAPGASLEAQSVGV